MRSRRSKRWQWLPWLVIPLRSSSEAGRNPVQSRSSRIAGEDCLLISSRVSSSLWMNSRAPLSARFCGVNRQRDMENTLQVNDPLPHSRAGWTEGLSANGRVNYVQQGKGMPVILTHGMAASLHDWDDLLPELSGSGFAGYALDLLGHGDSHKPAHYNEYTADSV